ncbi:hypothetical protein O6H91_15G065200 [Diphasiastrum complanatum]|uniref:Uncharacterized protein n=1 Tax=Diphasiastrum complanatum TaxID=34168 RepID=A0ACC2BJY9_DIPCM|nr:hypothetical protein O6H91_15G065200 [Diphasiastrum complanatum]
MLDTSDRTDLPSRMAQINSEACNGTTTSISAGASVTSINQFGDTTYTKMFVGGLAWETQKDTMRHYFEQFGEILEAVVITDKNTGRSKGYGFVTFRDAASARRACIDAAPIIDGRRANCNLAALGLTRPRSPFLQGNRANNRPQICTPFGTTFWAAAAAGTPPHNYWAPTYAQPGSFLYQHGYPYASPAICQYGYPSVSVDNSYPQYNGYSGLTQLYGGSGVLANQGGVYQYSSAYTQPAFTSPYSAPSSYGIHGPQVVHYGPPGVGVVSTVPQQYTGVPMPAIATASTGLVSAQPPVTTLGLMHATHSFAISGPSPQQFKYPVGANEQAVN